MIVIISEIAMVASLLAFAWCLLGLGLGIWPFTPSSPSQALTEALEASLERWHDAFDQVYDLADVDSTIFTALKAADDSRRPAPPPMLYAPGHYYDNKPLSSTEYGRKIAALPKLSQAEKHARLKPPPEPSDSLAAVTFKDLCAMYETRIQYTLKDEELFN